MSVIYFPDMRDVSYNLQINNKTYNFLHCKVRIAPWFWQVSVGFCWILVFIANLWFRLMKEGSWCVLVRVWSKIKVKQWRRVPELHLFMKRLCELESIRRIISSTFHLIHNLPTVGTIYFMKIFSNRFLSPGDQQSKNQTIIYRACQFPCENTPIIVNFEL